jgi:hypothetical protein
VDTTLLLKAREFFFLLEQRILLKQLKYNKQGVSHWLPLALRFLWFAFFKENSSWGEKGQLEPELDGGQETWVPNCLGQGQSL